MGVIRWGFGGISPNEVLDSRYHFGTCWSLFMGLKIPRSITNHITQQCWNSAPPSSQPPTPPNPGVSIPIFRIMHTYIHHKTEGFRLNIIGSKNLTSYNCIFNLSMLKQMSGNCIFGSDVAKAKFAKSKPRPRFQPLTRRPGPSSPRTQCFIYIYIYRYLYIYIYIYINND